MAGLPGSDVAPEGNLRDQDVGVPEQGCLDPPAVLVVQETLPPMERHIFGQEHEDDILDMLGRGILEEPDERSDQRSIR